jgi:hypothetical protein
VINVSASTVSLVKAPALPQLDPALGDTLGDELLLGAASQEKATKVTGARSGAFQSHTARAWTKGGQVD